MHPRSAVPALLTSLGLLLSGCSALEVSVRQSDEAASSSPSAQPTGAGGATASGSVDLTAFYEQDVAWSDCREDLECATVEVPVDYGDPGGRTIELALLRVPATGDRQGSLVVNPGGPGASGVDYAAQASTYFRPALREAFDIVGFDPRGVGRSDPVDCLSDEELDEFVAADPDPDTPEEVEEARAAVAAFGEGCLDRSGPLAAHVSTVEVARDMDVIRAALREERLTYFGASYGTLLGATYAELYPDLVGRMVLDGAIDPTLDPLRQGLVQARGFETALRAYVESCTSRTGCFLGDSVSEGTARIRRFLDAVERQPLPAEDDRDLEVGNAVLGIWTPLYSAEYWYVLDAALQAAFRGDGGPLLQLSDAYVSRTEDGYDGNGVEALYAVNCLDAEESLPVDEVPALVPRFERVSPTFGAIFAWGLASCSEWPVDGVTLDEPVDAAGAEPILVVGTSRDPATPLAWAEALAEQLESGVLVRRDGDGHTGYNAGNPCVDEVVEAYLVDGEVPPGPVDC